MPNKQEINTDLPTAEIVTTDAVRRQKWKTRIWWLTAICGLLAIGLAVSSFRSRGTSLIIHFKEGHGLKVGDTLHFRGVDVGTVTQVTISNDLDGIDVGILLTPGNENIAVEGSEFWIQRARLRLGQVSGLETVVGAKYVGVLPGRDKSKPQREFNGLESPLAITDQEAIEIRVQFPNGEGLEVGDPVRHRGISIGEVTFVELNATADAVHVGLRLVGSARDFAKAGTQFWIERPRLEITEVRGLETLLGGRYVAIQPTLLDSSESQSEFVGLSEAPPLPRRNGSLELELDAAERAGLVRGAPVSYRGLEVGRVSHVNLSSDGATVKVQVVIDAEYAELVRDNSKWWTVQGMQMDLGLQGLHLSVDSLSSWLRGGIAFATPDQPGTRVATGYRFPLVEKPNREWITWQPQIALGNRIGNEPHSLPKPLRVAATWKASWLGLYRRQSEQTWGIALSDGTLQLPATFTRAANRAEKVNIELAGSSFPFIASEVVVRGALASLKLPTPMELERWPVDQLEYHWDGKSNLLIINPELSEPMALDPSRFVKKLDDGFTIAPAISISEALAGSPVIDSKTGYIVGLLTRMDGSWGIAMLK
jgi:paraquat-inducible protein B